MWAWHSINCGLLDEAVLPVVDAGEDAVTVLPERTAILNGSLSQDGFGISSYRWSRSRDSPAAGGRGSLVHLTL